MMKSQNNVAIIILAAGASSRMGQPKQLLEWDNQPLIRRVAQTALAAQAEAVYVVVGGAGAAVTAALDNLPVQIVACPHYATGQSASLRAGIAALATHTDAALIMLGDQPFVTTAIIDALISVWRESRAPIVAPTFDGRRGNPVLFDRSMFAELLTVQGDQGARTVLQSTAAHIRLVPFIGTRALEDIDTIDDYHRIQAL